MKRKRQKRRKEKKRSEEKKALPRLELGLLGALSLDHVEHTRRVMEFLLLKPSSLITVKPGEAFPSLTN